MDVLEKKAILLAARDAYENEGIVPTERWIYDDLIKHGVKIRKPFIPKDDNSESNPYKKVHGIKKEFKKWQTDKLIEYKNKCANEVKSQYDGMFSDKKESEFITYFSNDEYRKMRYLLERHKSKLTNQRIIMIMAFHEYLRNNIDRQAMIGGKPNPNYYSCYNSLEQLENYGFNKRLIIEATDVLIDIGYLHKITITKTGCNYYPLFRQTTLS